MTPKNYRFEPPNEDQFEAESDDSDADTISYNPDEEEKEKQEIKTKPELKDNVDCDQHKEESIVNNDRQQDKETWCRANKTLKQRKLGQRKQHLIEWSDRHFKPSWQIEDDVSDELKRQFYIQHTKQGSEGEAVQIFQIRKPYLI